MRKMFSLMEVLIAVVVIGILSSIVYLSFENSPIESATNAEIKSNIRSYQMVVDKYYMDKREYPTTIQPTVTTPQKVDMDKLYPKYLKTSKTKHGNYWVDYQGKVWGSLLPLVTNVVVSDNKVSFDKLEDNQGYNIYKVETPNKVSGAVKSSRTIVKKIGSVTTEPYFTIPVEHQGSGDFLVSAIDKFNLEPAPAGENWIGFSDNFLPINQLKPGTYNFTTNANEVVTWIGWMKDDSIPAGASIDYSFATSNDNKTYTEFLESYPVGVKAQYMRVKVVIKANPEGVNPTLNKLRVLFQLEETIENPELKKPIAMIDMTPGKDITPDTVISWSSTNSQSMDGKVISSEEWVGKETQYVEGTHTVKLRVKNSTGVWSDWAEKTFNVAFPIEEDPIVPPIEEPPIEEETPPDVTVPPLQKPVAVIGYSPNGELLETTNIAWNSNGSYSPESTLSIVDEEWKNKNSTYAAGSHVVELRVKDSAGNWSDWATTTITVVTPKPIAVIDYSPKGDLLTNTTITWDSNNSYSPESTLSIVNEEWKNKKSIYTAGSHIVELRVQDSAGTWSDWAAKSIQVSEKPVIKPIAVIDYSPNSNILPTTTISWTPSNSYSPDGLSITVVEWKNKQDTYAVGQHVVELRVQNSDGVWSDWAMTTILIEEPPVIQPIAVITQTPNGELTPKTTLTWGYENSYSPDGLTIVGSEWKNKNDTYTAGTHLIELRVQNSAGIWSEWVSTTITVITPKPIAVIDFSPNTRLYDNTTISWNSTGSNSPDGLAITQEEWLNKKSTYPVGNHVVQLRVQNSDGVWSDWVSQTITITQYDKPVAVIGMNPSTNLFSDTNIVWDSTQSTDPNPFGFTIVNSEWENKQATYEEGIHTVRLRVQSSSGVWSDWTSKSFTVNSEWTTLSSMNYEVDAGSEGDWVSVEVEDIQPPSTRIVYKYSTSNDGSSWSNPSTDISEAANSRYLQVSIVQQKKESATSNPTFVSILVNYKTSEGDQTSTIGQTLNLEELQGAVDAYFADKGTYPSYSQPTAGVLQPINLNDLYPDYLEVNSEDIEDTFWVDNYGQVYLTNTSQTFDSNRVGNMMNGGLFEEKDNVIYYSNPIDGNKFYKMNANHLSKTQLSTSVPYLLTHYGDTLYHSESNTLYKTTNGTSKVSLGIAASSSYMIKANADWIYAQDGTGLLKRVRPDGTSVQSYKRMTHFDVIGEWIYYTDPLNSNSLYKMKQDGTSVTKITTFAVSQFTIIDDKMYYINANDRFMYKYDLTTSETITLSTVNIGTMNVSDGWIYYTNQNDNSSLYKMRLNATEITKMNSDSSTNIHVLGEWIYYRNQSDSNKMYKIKKDGTGRSLFEAVPVTETPIGSKVKAYNVNNAMNVNLSVDGNNVDGWVYFADPNNGNFWTKMRPDGSSKTVLSTVAVYLPIVIENKVFMKYNNQLYSANLDFTNLKKLSDTNPNQIIVEDDWVYFTSSGTYKYIYRVQTDGKNRTIIHSSATIDNIIVKDSFVYFTNNNDNYKLYQVKGDGTQAKKFVDTRTPSLAAEGDWIYYTDSNGYINKIKKDGSGNTQLNSKYSTSLNVSDGWIYYYSNMNGASGISKLKIDGTVDTLLVSDYTDSIDIVGDWIYYRNNSDSSRIYKIKKDGTNRYFFESVPTETPIGGTGKPYNVNNAMNVNLSVDGNNVDGWVYFADPNNGNFWTKMRPDGSSKTALGSVTVYNPVIVENKVYMNYNNQLYSANLDFTSLKKLSNTYPTQIVVEDDWVYFTSSGSYKYIYRVQTDGGNQTMVTSSATIDNFIVKDGFVYFTNYSDNYKLYQVKGDGTQPKKLVDTRTPSLAAEGDWIYYTDSNGYINKINKDGSGKTQLNSKYSTSLNVLDGWIYYYSNTNGASGISKLKVDGAVDTLLVSDYTDSIDVVGDWIYYRNISDSSRIYKIKKDGTNRYFFESIPTETPLGGTGKQVNINNSVNLSLSVDGNNVDGWVYFADPNNGNFWTKMLPDGSSKTALSSVTVYNPVVIGNKVYMNYNNQLYSANVDFTNLKKLSDTYPTQIVVEDDWVYFTSSGSYKYIYRVQTDGKNQTMVTSSATIDNFIVKDGFVYFTNYSDNYYLYRVKGDGTSPVKLLNSRTPSLAVEGDWIYYTDPNGYINKINKDGSGKVQLNSKYSTSLNVSDGWIYYYANINGASGISKLKIDGTVDTLLVADYTDGIDIVGDWIYYRNNSDSSRIYKVKKDGTNRYFFESSPTETPHGGTGRQYNLSNAMNPSLSVDGNNVDGWVYYADPNNGNFWTKMLPDGSSKTVLGSIAVYTPVVVGNKVYMNYNNQLYSANVDFTNLKLLSATYPTQIVVEDDWVYFTSSGSYKYIYRVQTDGKNQTMVTSATTVDNFIVKDGFVYYTNGNDNYYLYKVKGDGTNSVKLLSSRTPSLAMEGDWIYYTDPNGYINKINKDGSGKVQLNSKYSTNLNVSDGWIYYYANISGAYGIYKLKVDGTVDTLLIADSTDGIDIVGDWIYYRNNSDSSRIYKIKKDGTNRSYFESPLTSTIGSTTFTENAGNSLTGYFSYQSSLDTVFYRNYSNGYIYKMTSAGLNPTQVTSYPVNSLTSAGDWLYVNYNNQLHKVKSDNTGLKLLSPTYADNIIVVGDWVYYRDMSYGYMYRVDINGNNRMMLTSDRSGKMYVSGDWIYFSNLTDNYRLYKMKTDGTQKTKLSDNYSQMVQVSGSNIFYINGNDANYIYTVGISGTVHSKVGSVKATTMNISNDWIYFSNSGDLNKLYKIKTDGTGLVKLNDDNIGSIHVTGSWIYYSNNNDGKNYRININGTSRTVMP